MFGKANPPLALDIGSHSVKLVQLERKKKAVALARLGMASLASGAVREGRVQDHEEVMRAVDELLSAEKVKARQVVVALSGAAAAVRRISIPRMRGVALEEAVAAETAQIVPFPLEEARCSRYRCGTVEVEGETMDEFLVVAVRKEPLEELVDLLRHLKLQPKIVDVNVLALESALDLSGVYVEEDNLALVDIGASGTLVHVLRGDRTLMTRTIPLGGETVTEALARKLDVSPLEAERVKVGVDPPPSPRAAAEAVRGAGARLCRELGRTFQLLWRLRPEERVGQIILSGGGAHLEGLSAYLAASLDITVTVSDPFRALEVPGERFDRDFVETMGPIATVAAGLAYRALEAA